MKFKVRDNFVVKVGREVFHGGEFVELDEQQAEDFANIIEPAEKPVAKAVKKQSEAAEDEAK